MTRPGVLPPTAPSSWLPGPPTAARAVSAPRWAPKSAVVQGSRVVQPPVCRYPGVVVQAYSPGVKVAVRQVSSPNLSPALVAHSPGLLVQHRGAVCAPLPTWAAPATPPRAGMSCKVPKESDELPRSAPAAPSGSEVETTPATEATAVSREDELRAKLELTRRELNQKMNELRDLEASLLSNSYTKRLTDPVPGPCDVLVEESETTGQSSGTPSPDSQTFFKCSTRAVATDTDDLVCEAVPETECPAELKAISFQAVEEVDEAQQVQESQQEVQKVEDTPATEDTLELSAQEVTEEPVTLPKRLVANPQRDRDPKTKDRDRSSSVRVRIVPPRPSASAATAAARSRSTSKDRPRMATQLHVPVSARLSSRREARAKGQSLEKRSDSALELVGPRQRGTALELADVARLVASPEIGTLDDFLPNPLPEPEALSEKAEVEELCANQKTSAAVLSRNNQDSSSSSSACQGRRRSMPGSPKRGAAAVASDRRDAPETTRVGSRMLWREQLTALSCSELPRRSPSPQRMPRTTTPSRAKTPNRGTSATRALAGRNEVDAASRSQKKTVTWKPKCGGAEAAAVMRPRSNEEVTSQVAEKRVKIPDH